MVENVIQNKNEKRCQCECKRTIKHHMCEEDRTRNPSMGASECGKDCRMPKRLHMQKKFC